jgi:arylsulfatase A-like enzyme
LVYLSRLPQQKDSAYGLTSSYPSIASLMKASGYETALIGKWHLGFLPQYSPLKTGLTIFSGFTVAG